uniref:Uncharacterized protein n=1 Tax=Fagus sylvatica TaxID=28930 RepID=A0A2N9FSK0_FAGSY
MVAPWRRWWRFGQRSGEISPDPARSHQIWRDLTKSGNQLLGTAKNQTRKKSDGGGGYRRWRSTRCVEVWRCRSTRCVEGWRWRSMRVWRGGGATAWRGGGAASWQHGGCCGVAAWKALWACGVEIFFLEEPNLVEVLEDLSRRVMRYAASFDLAVFAEQQGGGSIRRIRRSLRAEELRNDLDSSDLVGVKERMSSTF